MENQDPKPEETTPTTEQQGDTPVVTEQQAEATPAGEGEAQPTQTVQGITNEEAVAEQQTVELSQEEKDKSNAGRPALDEDEKMDILRKLEPYLKSGISINKACLEAGIPKSTVYDYIKKDTAFSEKITQFKNYLSVVYNSTVNSVLFDVMKKINKNRTAAEGEEKEKLTPQEYDFLKWFGEKSKHTKEEYGERKEISVVDPEQEIARITSLIDEKASDA